MNTLFLENLPKDTLHFWKLQYIDNLPPDANVRHCNEIRSSKFMYVKHYFNRTINQYEEYTNDSIDNEEFLLIRNINNEILSNVVNPQGIVRIGDSLYQFKRNVTKSILASSPEKIMKLINSEPNNSNSDFEVVFSSPKSTFSSKTANCDLPGYYTNIDWVGSSSINFSSNPKYRLELNGSYFLSHDYYCKALYTPVVKVSAKSYKKSWYNINWIQVLNYKSLEVSYITNHPNGSVTNEYSLTGTNSFWDFTYSKVFPQINSQTYSSLFYVTNFYTRSTMAGGSSGGSTFFKH